MTARSGVRELKLVRDPDRDHTKPHVSEILAKIAVGLGVLTSRDGIDEDDAPPMVCAGLAWEDWLGPQLEREDENFVYHPPPCEHDGIIASTDGLWTSPSNYETVVHEIKFTKKSARHDPTTSPKWILWLWQVMAYIKVYEARREAVFHVLHINGVYEKHTLGDPLVIDYYVEFTEQEIEENWDMILANRPKD